MVLLLLHDGLHAGWRDQSDVLAEIADHPTPVVSACAGLHRQDAGWLPAQEFRQPGWQKLALEDNGPVRLSAVRLQYVFGQIQADDANLIQRRSLRRSVSAPADLAAPYPLKRLTGISPKQLGKAVETVPAHAGRT